LKYVWIIGLALIALATAAYWFWPRSGGEQPRVIKVTGEFKELPEVVPHVKVTMAHYNAIQIGMTYDQIKDIIGEDGMPTSAERVRDTAGRRAYITLIEWKNDDGSALSGQFQNFKLINKYQRGLE